MTEPTEDQYAGYFDAAGQPIRSGAVALTEDEAREFALYFPDETTTSTEEIQ